MAGWVLQSTSPLCVTTLSDLTCLAVLGYGRRDRSLMCPLVDLRGSATCGCSVAHWEPSVTSIDRITALGCDL